MKDLFRSIKRLIDVLELYDLGIDFRSLGSIEPSYELRNLALSNESAYHELYLETVRSKSYNIMLSDYSVISFYFSNSSLRYAFLGNPFDYDHELFNCSDDAELFDELGSLKGRLTLLRYEYDPSAHEASFHPVSHFHIGHGAVGRIGVSRKLSPIAFGIFIIRHFYFDNILQRDPELANMLKPILCDAFCEELRSCESVAPELFTDDEQRLLHMHAR